MLAKRYRLPIQQFVKMKGKSAHSAHFSFKIFTPEKEYGRFGIILSKKVAQKATARNALKRQLFSFLETIKESLPIADYLIIVRPGAAALAQQEMKKELHLLYGRVI